MENRKFYDGFANYEDFVEQWSGASDISEDEVIIAGYFPGDYDGSAFCLYEREGMLFEVYDSHCSCNGLENWNPEEASLGALNEYWFSDASSEFKEALELIIARKKPN